ncbi:MAG: ATP-dependent endonuclease [Desulfobulbaceae bacterium]|nr:ATP-dependent endonuclease [Desulfobulbaceae bacterium]
MRIENIEIDNYRSVQHCTVRCGMVTVFLGRNNHGKSNILTALDFFCGSGMKCTNDDFFRSKETRTNTLWVEVTFTGLSEQEKTTFSKYVAANERLKVRKIATVDDAGKIDISYRGWVSEPTQPWLKTDYTSTKKTDLEPKLQKYLPEDVRYSKDAVKTAQQAYIKEHPDDIDLEYSLEDGNFLGRANVASGVLPEAFLIPAIRDLNDETKTKSTTLFGRLLNRAMGEMAEADEDFQKVKADLTTIVQRLNRREGEKDTRPFQLRNLEKGLEDELSDWEVKLNISISAPDIEKIFELGTSLDVDDGVVTAAEEKGNGLQRAIIFALTRSWANVLRKQGGNVDITPRGASESVYLLIEEPELYLHPHAQKALSANLREIARAPHHQVFLSSHSPQFIDMSAYRDIAIVEKTDSNVGSCVRQSNAVLFDGETNVDRKRRFNLGYWINPERAELFFARKVVFVEGPTEKVVLPYLAEKLGVFDVGISIVDCGSKFNLSVYMELAGSFGIQHAVLHDEDPIAEGLEGEKLESATRTFALNQEINELSKKTKTSVEMVAPDFEALCGISRSQGKVKGKPLAAIDHFEGVTVVDYEQNIIDLVRRLYS